MAKLSDTSPDIPPASPLAQPVRQFEALLEVSETIAQQRDLKLLFHELSNRLHAVLQFDFLGLILHDPARGTMRLHILETKDPLPEEGPEEMPVANSPSGWVFENQELFLTQDTSKDARYPHFMKKLQAVGVHSTAILPLTTAHHRLGTMVFGRFVPEGISETEIQFMRRVAAQVAVAVDNALNFEAAEAYQKQLARERDRLQVLLEINNLLVSTRDPSTVFKGIVSSIKPVLQHDYTSLALLDTASGLLKIHYLDLPGNSSISKAEITVPLEGSPAGQCFSTNQILITRGKDLDKFQKDVLRFLREQSVQAICCVPLTTHGRTFGTINLASRNPDAFTPADVELLQQVGVQVAIALENALAFKEIDALKDKLAVEKLYLEEEIRSEFNFEEIIGESAVLRRTLAQVELAAPAGTTVLIQGETGTGKEIIARAIHNLSPRRERTFVKVNCAAIPAGLLESELFGHERGAFTGAQEFERLGGNRTLRVDVRVVAATNGDLAQLVAERKFRSDLYYRLNVFPILVPPLRERREDVPLLVRYFVQTFSRRQNKTVEYIPADVMDALVNYSWPGNIRELENLIERAVLLSPGKELRVPIGELKAASAAFFAAAGASDQSSYSITLAPGPDASATPIATLEDADRQHILRALRQTKWRIAGPGGAASLLGMKRTTLQARIRKLGIKRPV